MSKFNGRNQEEKEFEERVLVIRRVSKKTTGGNYVSFSALVAIGDRKGRVGIGLGRGLEVPPAIQKAITQAKKNLVTLPIFNDTLPHEIMMKYKSSRLLLKPAPPGTGLKVGGVVRAVLDIAGVNNASGKIIGTRNQITNAYAVIRAIKLLKPRIVVQKDGSKPEDKGRKAAEAPVKVAPKKEVQKEVVEEVAVEKDVAVKKAVKKDVSIKEVVKKAAPKKAAAVKKPVKKAKKKS